MYGSKIISQLRNGASDPSTTNLMALANLFGVTPEELLKEMSL
ncbi:MAG: helix-turn-helix transcriptional regulator [Eubacterium sp.]|nr:helix-turn-helix transcriptional regulator [Eubacterium sp.]